MPGAMMVLANVTGPDASGPDSNRRLPYSPGLLTALGFGLTFWIVVIASVTTLF